MSYYFRRNGIRRILEMSYEPKSQKEYYKVLLPMGLSRNMINRILEELTAGDLLERIPDNPTKWKTISLAKLPI